jgi:hypothetical protein
VVASDYNDSDHVTTSIAIVTAGTFLHFMITIMRMSKRYNRGLYEPPFAVSYCVLSGVTLAFLVVSYSYYLVTLPKFDAVYSAHGFSDLHHNGLPTAAFVFTVVYVSGQTGFTFATLPRVEWAATAGTKAVTGI